MGVALHTGMPGGWSHQRSKDSFGQLDTNHNAFIEKEEFISFYMVSIEMGGEAHLKS